MATIALYSNKINCMSGLVQETKKAVIDYRDELFSLRTKMMRINKNVCNMDDIIRSIQTSTETQERKIGSLGIFQERVEQFVAGTVKVDNEVAELVTQRKDDFYGKYSYLKPECEKNGWEKFCDGCKKTCEWCKENWQSILSVIAIVVVTIAAVVVCIATFGAMVVAVSVLVGITVGLVGQFVADCITSIVTGRWNFSSWQTYVGAGLGGGVGALALLFSGGNEILASSVSGGVSTFFAQNLENITGGEKRSFAEIILNTSVSVGASAFFAKLFPLKIQKITAGRGNFSAVYKGVITKLKKGIIHHVSTKTIVKGVVSGIVGDFWQTLFWGTYEGMCERFRQGWKLVQNNNHMIVHFAD